MGQRLAVNSFTVINRSSTAKNTSRSQRHSLHAIAVSDNAGWRMHVGQCMEEKTNGQEMIAKK
jgi:hypothetical protein